MFVLLVPDVDEVPVVGVDELTGVVGGIKEVLMSVGSAPTVPLVQ
jgi:hypothetical protein